MIKIEALITWHPPSRVHLLVVEEEEQAGFQSLGILPGLGVGLSLLIGSTPQVQVDLQQPLQLDPHSEVEEAHPHSQEEVPQSTSR